MASLCYQRQFMLQIHWTIFANNQLSVLVSISYHRLMDRILKRLYAWISINTLNLPLPQLPYVFLLTLREGRARA